METIKPQGYRFHKSGSTSPITNATLSRSNSTNSISDQTKLNQIVRRIVLATPSLLVGGKNSQAQRNAVIAIVDIVYEKHREYRRKERETVIRGVEGVIGEILAETANSGNSPASKKRRVAVGGGSEGCEGEEAKRSKIASNSSEIVLERQPSIGSAEVSDQREGGMLNASLRNRYKEQREKEVATTAVIGAANISEAESTTINKTDEIPTEQPSNNQSGTTPNPKKKKIKKTTPKKSIPSSNNTDPIASNAFLLPSPRPSERYSTLGGISSLLTTIRQLIEYPLSHPELFVHLGIEPPRGVLLRGPPGCGKVRRCFSFIFSRSLSVLIQHYI
jgi:SpoVK/Ycf46/Vps4 family AAA+-type ATPase